mgnify:CR=1 FL=1
MVVVRSDLLVLSSCRMRGPQRCVVPSQLGYALVCRVVVVEGRYPLVANCWVAVPGAPQSAQLVSSGLGRKRSPWG